MFGSLAATGRQLAWPGLGRWANAVFSVALIPSDTPLPSPVKSAGLPTSQIAAAQAITIQIVPSMVLVPRLRIRPCQASQIAPMITITAT